MSTMGFKIFQPRRRGDGEKRWSRIGNTVIRTSAGWWVCGGSLYYLLHFCKCLTFFHYKKFVVFLFVSLEREKKKDILFKLCTLPCYNKPNVYTKISTPLSQNIFYFRPSLSDSLNKYIVKLSVSKSSPVLPCAHCGAIWIDLIPPLRECNSPTIMSSIHLWGHHIAQHWGLIFSSILLMFF